SRPLRARPAPELGPLRRGEGTEQHGRRQRGEPEQYGENEERPCLSHQPGSDPVGFVGPSKLSRHHTPRDAGGGARERGAGGPSPELSFPLMMPTEASWLGVPGTLVFALVLIG